MEVKRIRTKMLDSNIFLIKEGERCLIVDCAMEVDSLQTHLEGLRVVGILLTHGHFDHCCYIEEYLKAFDCPVVASKHIKETMSKPTVNYGGLKFENFENFIFFKDGEKVEINGFEIDCFNMQGHSKCCACFLIDENLFAGDVLFFSGIGRCDLHGGDCQKMQNSLKRLLKLKFKKCHSGHYQSTSYEHQKSNILNYID